MPFKWPIIHSRCPYMDDAPESIISTVVVLSASINPLSGALPVKCEGCKKTDRLEFIHLGLCCKTRIPSTACVIRKFFYDETIRLSHLWKLASRVEFNALQHAGFSAADIIRFIVFHRYDDVRMNKN